MSAAYQATRQRREGRRSSSWFLRAPPGDYRLQIAALSDRVFTLADADGWLRVAPAAAFDGCRDGGSKQIVETRRAAARADHRAFDDILQLADVARPGITLKLVQAPRRQVRLAWRFICTHSRSKKCWANSGMSSVRSRSGTTSNRKDAQAKIQILPKSAGDDVGFQIAIRGGDHPDVDLARLVVADSLDLPFLQHAQQLALQVERNFADLVEKQRAAVGQLEAADPVLDRAGERSFHMPEELAFKQLARHGGAVHLDQRTGGPPAALMDRTSDQFLARSLIPRESSTLAFGGGDEFDLLEQLAEGRASPDDFAEGMGLVDLLTQVTVLRFELPPQTLDFLERPCVGDGDCRLVGEGPQPVEVERPEPFAAENREHAQDFSAKFERDDRQS